MEQEQKLVLGKILGETYRLQKEQGICQETDATIFGLLNGFEETLNAQMTNLGIITVDEVEKVADYFSTYWKGEEKLDDLPSYKTVQMSMERHGIREHKFGQILKYLYACNRFTVEIEKLGRNMKLSEYDI
ncbi:hypothetical protein [Halobacillus litoralis]|uniref:hypothetical protein n=1 Tax=Halobacillus litoralis TaxID=45668 RepID=UPI00248FF9B0|nr:hypothetical protein [Halobacillus litoralis]